MATHYLSLLPRTRWLVQFQCCFTDSLASNVFSKLFFVTVRLMLPTSSYIITRDRHRKAMVTVTSRICAYIITTYSVSLVSSQWGSRLLLASHLD